VGGQEMLAAIISFEYFLQTTEDNMKQIVFFTLLATYTYEYLTFS
jgi:hypothetical protein